MNHNLNCVFYDRNHNAHYFVKHEQGDPKRVHFLCGKTSDYYTVNYDLGSVTWCEKCKYIKSVTDRLNG